MIPGLRELQTRTSGEPPVTAGDFVRIIRTRLRMNFPLPEGVADAPVIHAEVNQGRWIARCPFCAGAELVDLEEPLFYCLSCYNATAGHRWLRVRLPRERTAIEVALEKRPLMAIRNWHPSETVTALRAENVEHGIGE